MGWGYFWYPQLTIEQFHEESIEVRSIIELREGIVSKKLLPYSNF